MAAPCRFFGIKYISSQSVAHTLNAAMSYNSIFDSASSDTSSQDSVQTIIFNPTLAIHTFSRNGSWSAFPPPITRSPADMAASQHPAREIAELPPLGSEPRDPTLRVPTSDLIDAVQFIENIPPPAYASHPIYDTDESTLARSIAQGDCRGGLQFGTSEFIPTEGEPLDNPGIMSLGQRIAQEERRDRSRRVRFGAVTEHHAQPWAWPEDSSSEDEEDGASNPSTSMLLDSDHDVAEQMPKERGRRGSMWYNREPSYVERMDISWWMRWKDCEEDCVVCVGACAVM